MGVGCNCGRCSRKRELSAQGIKYGQWSYKNRLKQFFGTGKMDTNKSRAICPVCGERLKKGEKYVSFVCDWYRGRIKFRKLHYQCFLNKIELPTAKELQTAKKFKVLDEV